MAEAQPSERPPGLAGGYAWRIALFFTALFLVAGTKLPYLPVWLDWRGLTKAEIAVVTAAPLFLRIAAGPLIAMIADWWGDRRAAILVLATGSLAGLSLLGLAGSFWPILAVTVLAALATTGLMPLAETMAMAGVRQGGLDYGRMRLWGSLSFIVAGFVAGAAISGVGPEAVLWLLIAGGATTLGAALLLPADPGRTAPGGRRFSAADALRFAASPRFLLFVAAAGAVQASHAVFYTFGVIEWRRQGLSAAWASVLWAIGVGVEVGLFAVSRPLVERFGARLLILAGAGAGILRWTCMAFDPPLWALMPLQALHGLTFGATHLGALHFMSATVPPAQASTAQALYASVTAGIGMGLATLVAGPFYEAWGGRAYLAMAVMAAAGLLAGLALGRVRAPP